MKKIVDHRYRLGKEGLFGKSVLILQVKEYRDDGPPDYDGLPTYLAGEYWRDALVEDLTFIKSEGK